MRIIFYLLPSLFLIFTFFFGWIATSILIRKKPVVLSAKWINGLITLSFLPIILISLVSFRIENLITPLIFVALLIFYYFVIQGYLFYGITDDDFRKYLLESLKKLGIEYEESMSKIKFKNSEGQLNISFQEWVGSGMIKAKKDPEKKIKEIIAAMKSLMAQNQIQSKKVTGIFYLVFSILFGICTIFFSKIFMF